MQMRCNFCQNMYALSRTEMLIALQHMKDENLQHYDAHCPKCRRATRVERAKLEHANPDWEKTLAELIKEQAKAEKEAKKSAAAEKPTEAKPAAKKAEKPVESKPAAKKVEKPAGSKPAAAKPAVKKPAAAKAK